MYWLIVQLNIANLGTRIPDKYFRQKHIIFKSFNFEKHGKFWNKWFYVRKWKHKILDGHKLNRNIYDQRHLMTIIIVQRYNRPRLTQLLRILKRRGERHD